MQQFLASGVGLGWNAGGANELSNLHHRADRRGHVHFKLFGTSLKSRTFAEEK